MKALRQYMSTVEQRGKKGRRAADAEAQPPERTLEERSAKRAKHGSRRAADDDGDGPAYEQNYGARAVPDEDPFYAEVVAAKAAKKQQKAAKAAEENAAQWAARTAAQDESPAG